MVGAIWNPDSAGADQREPRTAVVDRVVPTRRVERRTLKVVHAGDVRHARRVERADRADHHAGVEHLGGTVGSGDRDRPTAGRVVVLGGLDARVEPAVSLQLVRVHDPLEVGAELRVLREVLGPMVGGLERVAVEVAADVDARTRVAVLPPRAAGAAVLLDDGEGQLGLREADAGEQPGLAAPDDDHVRVVTHVGGDLVAPRDGTGVGAVEVEVLHEHRHDGVGHRPAGQELHHLPDQLVRRWGRKHAPGVAEGDDRR